MNFFIKILNESRGRKILKADGYSGARYIFKWDGVRRAYVYQPVSQDEVDDLFRTMGRTTAYLFAPINLPVTAETASTTVTVGGDQTPEGSKSGTQSASEPIVTEQPRIPLADILVEQCLHRGVVVTSDDSNETAERLIKAYDKGAGDALLAVKPARRPARTQRPATPT